MVEVPKLWRSPPGRLLVLWGGGVQVLYEGHDTCALSSTSSLYLSWIFALAFHLIFTVHNILVGMRWNMWYTLMTILLPLFHFSPHRCVSLVVSFKIWNFDFVTFRCAESSGNTNYICLNFHLTSGYSALWDVSLNGVIVCVKVS
jgi:hypothetical protein